MPHCCGTREPWIDEYGKSAWRLLVLRCQRRMWRGVVGRESEEKGGVSVEMFDGQRHVVEWNSVEGVSCASRYQMTNFKRKLVAWVSGNENGVLARKKA